MSKSLPDPFATHHEIEVQGIPTHVILFNPEGETPFLFLHGWGGSTQSFFALVKNLAPKLPQYRFYLIDYPGFGLTGMPPKEGFSSKDYAAWVEDLCKTLGIKKAVFYGHSNGGRILLRLAQKAPEKIEKLILSGAAGIHLPKSLREKIGAFLSRITPKALKKWRLRNIILTKIFGARDWASVPEPLKPTLKKILSEEDFASFLPEISTPTLILWGAKDTVTPLKAGEILAEKLPHAVLKIFASGRHGIHYTHQKEIIAAILDFLAEDNATTQSSNSK